MKPLDMYVPVFSCICLWIAALFLVSLPNQLSANGGIKHLVKEGQSIGNAVKNAENGDTVVVGPGTYLEQEIVIDKTLVIRGEKWPVIDAGGQGDIFLIAADSVFISGFELRNTGYSAQNDNAAVKVFDSRYLHVEDNKIIDAFFGIHISNSRHIFIRNNYLEAFETRSHRTGNGIHLWKTDTALIEGNYVKGHRDGIYLEFAVKVETSHNVVEDNNRYGLHFMFSHDNGYYHNEFRRNEAGVAVMYTRNVIMKYNLFEHSLGSGSYGVLLKDISHSVMKYNRIENNTTGIYMDGSNNNEIHYNLFRRNGWGIKLLASNDGNTLKGNNFTGNTFDISTNGRLVTNTLEGNYWDKYEGYDLVGDGYGDVPYRPISLYSTIVERIPSAIILWRSFMVSMMDRAERVIPSITPENMKDLKPKMRPNDIDFKSK